MKHLLLTTIAAVVLATTAFADPIHDAARTGDLAGVQAELNKGVDVNAKNDDGQTPLHNAAIQGHKEIAELLIAKGADVNAKNDINGGTPLDWATHPDNPNDTAEIADLLRKHGGKTKKELEAAGK
jgi:ankyrin repeat protein